MPDWRNPEDYAYCRGISWHSWVWELLRRNPAFVRAWRAYQDVEAALAAAPDSERQTAVDALRWLRAAGRRDHQRVSRHPWPRLARLSFPRRPTLRLHGAHRAADPPCSADRPGVCAPVAGRWRHAAAYREAQDPAECTPVHPLPSALWMLRRQASAWARWEGFCSRHQNRGADAAAPPPRATSTPGPADQQPWQVRQVLQVAQVTVQLAQLV